jgi:hypothetical protein
MKKFDLLKNGLVLTKELILSGSDVKKIATNNWGSEIGNWIPSYDPVIGDVIEFYVNDLGVCKKVHREEGNKEIEKTIVEFAGDNGLYLCFINGLVQIEKADEMFDFLPIGRVIVSYSYHIGNYFVPFIKKIAKGVYRHGTFSSQDYHEADDIVIFYHPR